MSRARNLAALVMALTAGTVAGIDPPAQNVPSATCQRDDAERIRRAEEKRKRRAAKRAASGEGKP